MTLRNMPLTARLYVLFLWTAGIGAAALTLTYPMFRPFDTSLVIYALLAAFTARVAIKFPYTDIHFSLDTPFIFVILILYGPLPALIVDAITKVIMTAPVVNRDTWYKIPFNIASGAVAILAAFLAFDLLAFNGLNTSSNYMLPIAGMITANFVVVTVTVAIVICILQKQNLVVFWAKNFAPTGVGYLASGAIATMLFILDAVGAHLGFFVSIPMVGLVYFSQKVYSQKENASVNHINELEKLHLSTIQSLSLALDAKDSYTHGHVKRVSQYAIQLAKLLGIKDQKTLKALAFAGLVHDIGKIAVPDAILNKKGKYTDAEFARMKVHPVVSAEILKSIPLPFPTAKIVRHHHEKWNGNGYPAALAGEEIPWESRLLAVADVYDAIRSDRPYRPKMEKERAVKIMKSERGKTLDASIVDIFLENLDQIENNLSSEPLPVDETTIHDVIKASHMPIGNEPESEEDRKIRIAKKESILFNGVYELNSSGNPDNGLKVLSGAIAEVVSHTAIAFYVPDQHSEMLVPGFVAGKDAEHLTDNTMKCSQGISGWVYTNGEPMMGSPPSSEFPMLHNDNGRIYKSTLSIPLGVGGQTFGVLSLYSENKDAFSEEDKDLLAKIGGLINPNIFFPELVTRFKKVETDKVRPLFHETAMEG